MKHSIRNMFKVILVVIMLLLLPAVGNKTAAEGEHNEWCFLIILCQV